MANTQVLKKHSVRMGLVRHLQAAAPEPAGAGEPRVRIIDQKDDGAVIEVTCVCGQRIQVHCTYAGTARPQVGPAS